MFKESMSCTYGWIDNKADFAFVEAGAAAGQI